MSDDNIGNPPDSNAYILRLVEGIDGVRVDGDRVLGPAAAAARLCVTERSEHGVTVSTYRHMMKDKKNPAPGPLPERNTTTGKQEFDLGAVLTYHRARSDEPVSWWDDINYRTPYRHTMLSAVAAGEVTVQIGDSLNVEIVRNGEVLTGRAAARGFSDLHRSKMIEVPPTGGRVTVSDAGRKLLESYEAAS